MNKYLVMRMLAGRAMLCASPTFVHNFPNTEMQFLTKEQAIHYKELLEDAYPDNVYSVFEAKPVIGL